jgi:hypothetical protein
MVLGEGEFLSLALSYTRTHTHTQVRLFSSSFLRTTVVQDQSKGMFRMGHGSRQQQHSQDMDDANETLHIW